MNNQEIPQSKPIYRSIEDLKNHPYFSVIPSLDSSSIQEIEDYLNNPVIIEMRYQYADGSITEDYSVREAVSYFGRFGPRIVHISGIDAEFTGYIDILDVANNIPILTDTKGTVEIHRVIGRLNELEEKGHQPPKRSNDEILYIAKWSLK